jgi:hypothetical protein
VASIEPGEPITVDFFVAQDQGQQATETDSHSHAW